MTEVTGKDKKPKELSDVVLGEGVVRRTPQFAIVSADDVRPSSTVVSKPLFGPDGHQIYGSQVNKSEDLRDLLQELHFGHDPLGEKRVRGLYKEEEQHKALDYTQQTFGWE